MKNDDLSDLLTWSYIEGYKAAMNILISVASDRSKDELLMETMKKGILERLKEWDKPSPLGS